MELIIRQALTSVNSAAGRLFIQECGIESYVESADFQAELIRILATGLPTAKVLVKQYGRKMAKTCRSWGQSFVEVFWSKDFHPYVIQASLGRRDNVERIQSGEQVMNSPIIIPQLDLSLDEAYRNPLPVWIIAQHTQKVLFANPAALSANERPPEDILGSEINALWEQELLEELTSLVNRDRYVTDHTNTGWRWKQGSSGEILWTRVKHEFNVDYILMNFMGVPCRYELVKNAVPV